MTDRRLPVLYLSEMLASMDKIERYIGEISYEEFIHQEQLVDAIERNIEKIGEAAAAIPDARDGLDGQAGGKGGWNLSFHVGNVSGPGLMYQPRTFLPWKQYHLVSEP